MLVKVVPDRECYIKQSYEPAMLMNRKAVSEPLGPMHSTINRVREI
jgi:hypothetical protein